MDELIFKFFDKTITPEEKEELFALLDSDKKYMDRFIYLRNLYAITASIPQTHDTYHAASKLKQFKRSRNRRNISKYALRISIYAASLFFIVFLAGIAINGKGSDNQNLINEFIAPAGQRAMVKLYDGTQVWLNACSSLRYQNIFSSTERRVYLDGEGYFDVSHNPEQPFIISVGKFDVKVLGTKFNIFSYPGQDNFVVSVIEGTVKIYQPTDETNSMKLNAYECATLVQNKLIKRRFENTDFLLWKDGIYIFDDIPFQYIAEKLELYFEVRIDINNNYLKEYKFSGKFRQADGVESILRTLQKIYPFSFKRDEEKNIITIV